MAKRTFVKFTSWKQAVEQVGEEEALQMLNKGKYDIEYRKERRMREQALTALAKTDTRFRDLTVEQLEAEIEKRKKKTA